MINMKIDIDKSQLKKLSDTLKNHIESKRDEVSKESAELLLELSQSKVPVLSGELRDSGRVVKTENGYAVVYEAEHALITHERPQSMLKSGESRYLAAASEELISNGSIQKILKEGFKQ